MSLYRKCEACGNRFRWSNKTKSKVCLNCPTAEIIKSKQRNNPPDPSVKLLAEIKQIYEVNKVVMQKIATLENKVELIKQKDDSLKDDSLIPKEKDGGEAGQQVCRVIRERGLRNITVTSLTCAETPNPFEPDIKIKEESEPLVINDDYEIVDNSPVEITPEISTAGTKSLKERRTIKTVVRSVAKRPEKSFTAKTGKTAPVRKTATVRPSQYAAATNVNTVTAVKSDPVKPEKAATVRTTVSPPRTTAPAALPAVPPGWTVKEKKCSFSNQMSFNYKSPQRKVFHSCLVAAQFMARNRKQFLESDIDIMKQNLRFVNQVEY